MKTLGTYYLWTPGFVICCAASIIDETTPKRDLEPLPRIPNHHPKILLTVDEIGAGSNYEGIRQLNRKLAIDLE